MHSHLSLHFGWPILAWPPFSLHLKIKIKCNCEKLEWEGVWTEYIIFTT
jgi:hypothetical protein